MTEVGAFGDVASNRSRDARPVAGVLGTLSASGIHRTAPRIGLVVTRGRKNEAAAPHVRAMRDQCPYGLALAGSAAVAVLFPGTRLDVGLQPPCTLRIPRRRILATDNVFAFSCPTGFGSVECLYAASREGDGRSTPTRSFRTSGKPGVGGPPNGAVQEITHSLPAVVER